MNKVFIGGSRAISTLDSFVKTRLDRIVERKLPVIVGDANGADTAVQDYLRFKNYDLVEVFCSEGICRNNRGGWPVRSVHSRSARKDFSYFASKDRAMSNEASVGLMIWDKKSIGTFLNVVRLINSGKKVVIYLSSDKKFITVRDKNDINTIISQCPSPVKEKIESKISDENMAVA